MDSSQGTVDPRRRVSFASCSVARKKATILYSDHSGNIAKKLEKDIKVCKSGFKMWKHSFQWWWFPVYHGQNIGFSGDASGEI